MSPPINHACTLQGLVEHAQALDGEHDGVLLFVANTRMLLVKLVVIQIEGSVSTVTGYSGDDGELEVIDHYQTRGHAWERVVEHHLNDASTGKAQVLVSTGVFEEKGGV